MSLSKSDGGCGLAVKAPDCGSGYRGFESRQPPCRHFSSLAHLPARSGRTNRCPRCGEPHHPPRIGFVHDPPGRVPMIQIQATTNFALIPVWLRLAPFAAPGTPVALARWVPEVEASTHHGEGPNTSGALTRCSRLHRIHPTSSRICHPPRSYAVSRRMYRKLADYAGIWATWHLRGKADLVYLLCTKTVQLRNSCRHTACVIRHLCIPFPVPNSAFRIFRGVSSVRSSSRLRAD